MKGNDEPPWGRRVVEARRVKPSYCRIRGELASGKPGQADQWMVSGSLTLHGAVLLPLELGTVSQLSKNYRKEADKTEQVQSPRPRD